MSATTPTPIESMKSIALSLFAVLGMATAHGQAPVPGTTATLLFESTITTENAATTVPAPSGGTRSTFTTSSVRYINRDILEAMRIASLLDGTLTGWTLNRLATANGVGNIYATKPGKVAVPVPANLLTQPVNQGTATTGTVVTPTTGAPKPNLIRRAYATLNIRNGASTGTGTQVLKWTTFRSGATTAVVETRTDNFTVAGRSATGVGIIGGSYRVVTPKPVNLAPLLPVP